MLLNRNILSLAFSIAVSAALAHGASAADKPLLVDDFSDGNYETGPAWSAKKGTWKVQDGALSVVGDAEFSSISTTDFAQIEDGAFKLSFDVRFKGAEANGRNRFYVALRDKAGKGYQFDIAQGTTNNTIISRLDPATVSLSKGVLSPAQTFPADKFIPVVFTRNKAGVLKVTVNGKDYLTVTDATYNQFNTIQLSSRSADTTLVHDFDNIKLETLVEAAAVQPAAYYKPAEYRWFLQEVDFTSFFKKPSSGFGPVVAKGIDTRQIATFASLPIPAGGKLQWKVQQGFQGKTVARWEQVQGSALQLPALPAGPYWVTAKSFEADDRLGARKVFF